MLDKLTSKSKGSVTFKRKSSHNSSITTTNNIVSNDEERPIETFRTLLEEGDRNRVYENIEQAVYVSEERSSNSYLVPTMNGLRDEQANKMDATMLIDENNNNKQILGPSSNIRNQYNTKDVRPDEGKHLLTVDLSNPAIQNSDVESSCNKALKCQPSKPTKCYEQDTTGCENNDNIRPSPIVFLAAFGALLGALSMGLALGYTAPAFLDMEKNLNNSILDPDSSKREQQKSLIGSTMPIGALVASLASEPMNKLLGRRKPLMACGAPFVMGWLFLATANSVTMLILGRLFIGACCGIACSIAPTYVVEIAPPQIRGALGTGFQLMVVIGNLLASIFGMFLSWQPLAAWSLLPALGMSAIMIFMPESPNWYVNQNRIEDARLALKRLRRGSVDKELTVLTKASADQGSTDYSWEIITSRINAVLMYQSDIFKKASPDSDALMSTIWVCLAQVIATLVCSSLVDRLGRKILLWLSGAGSMTTLVVFGTYSFLAANDRAFQQTYAIVPLISLILFITFFSFGFGPIPWMMIPELSTSRVRSLVASFGACFAWTGAYIVTASMKPLILLVGDAWTYWILSIICALSCLFIFALPETKATKALASKQSG